MFAFRCSRTNLRDRFDLPFEGQVELCYIASVCEKCTMVAVTVFKSWLEGEESSFEKLGDFTRRFVNTVDLNTIRMLPRAMCRDTSSHMSCSESDKVTKLHDFRGVEMHLKNVVRILSDDANRVGYSTESLLDHVAKLPFVGPFYAQSFVAIACIVGVISNANHAAYAQVTDMNKPHCRALMQMGLKGLDAVNKTIQLVAERLGLPVKTVENVLCKKFRDQMLHVREYFQPGQNFYGLVRNAVSGEWIVARKKWDQGVWTCHWRH